MKTINVEKLRTLVAEHAAARIADGKLGCADILVNQNGKCVFHERYGTKSVGGEPLPANSVFRLASMTKPITVAAFMQLFDQNLVDLKAPVSDYLPGFKDLYVGRWNEGTKKVDVLRPARNTVLVYNLLSHTSGIGSYPLQMAYDGEMASFETIAQAVSYIQDKPIMFDPGLDYTYSATLGFDIAARILEVVTGEDFASYLDKHLLAPLGMTDTTFAPTPAQWARTVVMHGRDAEGHSFNADGDPRLKTDVFPGFPPSRCVAGGGLASTAEDYSKFAEMLLHGGVGADGTRVLSEEAVKRIRTPHVAEHVMGNPPHRWGLGVRVITKPTYEHGLGMGCYGWSGAFGSHFWVDPENGITAIHMKNSTYDGGAGTQTGNEFEDDVTASLE